MHAKGILTAVRGRGVTSLRIYGWEHAKWLENKMKITKGYVNRPISKFIDY